MIDVARAEPVVIKKHGRSVVVFIFVEEYEKVTQKQKKKLPLLQMEVETQASIS